MVMAEETQQAEVMISNVRWSESLGKLTEALCLAQLEFGEITKDTINPFYGKAYSDLATLIKATRPHLAKHKLALTQWPLAVNGRAGVTSILAHSSGEWMAADFTLPITRQDAQGAGSAITYSRRYAYQSILDVAGEEDDDGNAAVGKSKKQVLDKIEEAEDAFDQRNEDDLGLANFQMREVERLQKQNGITDNQLLAFLKAKFGVQRIEKVKRSDFDTLRVYVAGQMPIQEALETSLDGTGRTVIDKIVGEDDVVSVEGLLGSVMKIEKGGKAWLSIKMQDGFQLSDWHMDHEDTLKPYVGKKVEFLAVAKGKGEKTYFNVDSLELQA
jgi:hypothetical protein